MLIPLMFSIAIHLGLAYFVLPLNEGQDGTEKRHHKKPPKDGSSVESESIRVPGRIVVKPSPVTSPELKEEPIGQGEDCKEGHYFGIGITVDLVHQPDGRCLITSVATGGPAHRAGIKAGDKYLLVGEESCIIKGEEGSLAQLKLWRGDSGEALSLTLVRTKICSETVR